MNIKTIEENDRSFFFVYGVRYKRERDSEKDNCWGMYLNEEEAEKTAIFVRDVMKYEVVFINRQIIWVRL